VEILELYSELLHYPDSPQAYRKLVAYYNKLKMIKEAAAFQKLLYEKFSEPLNANDPNLNEEQ